jgi:hypothetical protein
MEVYFKVHTAKLLEEILENNPSIGILKVPTNVFRGLLCQVAQRASQINDPILNKLMCDLTLYEIADPSSKDFDSKMVKRIQREAKKLETNSHKNN